MAIQRPERPSRYRTAPVGQAELRHLRRHHRELQHEHQRGARYTHRFFPEETDCPHERMPPGLAEAEQTAPCRLSRQRGARTRGNALFQGPRTLCRLCVLLGPETLSLGSGTSCRLSCNTGRHLPGRRHRRFPGPVGASTSEASPADRPFRRQRPFR